MNAVFLILLFLADFSYFFSQDDFGMCLVVVYHVYGSFKFSTYLRCMIKMRIFSY